MRRFVLVAVCALALVPNASAGIYLGVYNDAGRFRSLTSQSSDSNPVILGWDQGRTWGRLFPAWEPYLGPVPVVGFKTLNKGVEAVTPRGIAFGKGDAYLISINRAVAAWAKPVVYVRPLAEMNAYWNVYCAFNANGTARNSAHTTAWFRKAFRRMYLILHGGSKDAINAKLAAYGLPGISTDLPANPYPALRVIWNPQGYGSPNIPKNSAAAYYPGDNYVDVVANDLYDIRYKAEWTANQSLYSAHPSKPYAIAEWGLWGIDDPAYVRRMASFVRNHPRVEFISYYNSKLGSTWDLGSKPQSRAAYKTYIVPLGT
jgi:hypothetical protein